MPKNNDRLILVSGATGQQGGAALKHLRDRGFPVRALTRDPSQEKARKLVGRGTEVARGDLDDHASLTREFLGRRVSLAVPEDSPLLRKPNGLARHEGGRLVSP